MSRRSYHRGARLRSARVARPVRVRSRPGRSPSSSAPPGSGKSTLLYLIGALDEPIQRGDHTEWPSGFLRNEKPESEINCDGTRSVSSSKASTCSAILNAVDNVLAPYLTQPSDAAGKTARGYQASATGRVWANASIIDRLRCLAASNNESPSPAHLLKQPSLILADEPTGELDSKNGEEVFRHLRTLHEQLATTTIVVVTHDQRYIRT